MKLEAEENNYYFNNSYITYIPLSNFIESKDDIKEVLELAEKVKQSAKNILWLFLQKLKKEMKILEQLNISIRQVSDH